MRRAVVILASAAAIIALSMLLGCGGSRSSSNAVIARVGTKTIDVKLLDHWTAALAGSDYFEESGAQIPLGIVNVPADYSRCVSRITELETPKTVKAKSRPSSELVSKWCHMIYQGVRKQATEYLVNAQWELALYAEHGVSTTESELKSVFRRSRAELFPTKYGPNGTLRTFLAQKRWVLADQLLDVRLGLLQSKLLAKAEREGKASYASYQESAQKWTARTSCATGYVVRHCRQFKGEPSSAHDLSPAVLLEQVAFVIDPACASHVACVRH